MFTSQNLQPINYHLMGGCAVGVRSGGVSG